MSYFGPGRTMHQIESVCGVVQFVKEEYDSEFLALEPKALGEVVIARTRTLALNTGTTSTHRKSHRRCTP